MEQILINYSHNEDNTFTLSVISGEDRYFDNGEKPQTAEIIALLNQIKNLL